ncbi:MAG: hypothetical protein LC128_06610 [Chitinophagales bacterium]|nr:hypothetical protein [Chitinophagales bacterium]
MKHYEIILKNEKEKTYRFISWLLISVNFITLFLLAVTAAHNKAILFILTFLALLSIPALKYFRFQKGRTAFGIAFILFTITWFFTPYPWIAIINLVFLILDHISSGKLKVEFYDDKIRFPSLTGKSHDWNELSNVILKDGILTIDFKSNRIIQQQIEEESDSINEKEFNEFCVQHLNSAVERK